MPVADSPFPAVEEDHRRVRRAILWNSFLWTAGHALTTGGFITYFGHDLGAGSLLMSVLLITPETAGIAGLVTRPLLRWFPNRKAVWLGASLASRFVAIGIPLLAWDTLRPPGAAGVWCLIALVAISHGLHAIASVAYFSWISDLIPAPVRGRFLGARQVASLIALLTVPLAAGYARDGWRTAVKQGTMSPDLALLAYVLAFSTGIVLLLVSLLPMLSVPHPPLPTPVEKSRSLPVINHSFRWLLLFNFWHAFASGLTQAAFFGLRIGPLGIGLGTYYLLETIMKLAQVPASLVAGRLCDRHGNKRVLAWSVVIVSASLFFWLAATKEQWWWLIFAYLLWGGWAGVNIAGPNLMLQLSPAGDNATQIALFDRFAGLLAGLSGLLGGFALSWFLSAKMTLTLGGITFGPYQILFLIGLIGRMTALLWLWPLQEPLNRGVSYNPHGKP